MTNPTHEALRAQQQSALLYALALMRNRLDVEAPMNAAVIQGYIDALIPLTTDALTSRPEGEPSAEPVENDDMTDDEVNDLLGLLAAGNAQPSPATREPCGHGWHFGGACNETRRPTIGDLLVERDDMLASILVALHAIEHERPEDATRALTRWAAGQASEPPAQDGEQ